MFTKKEMELLIVVNKIPKRSMWFYAKELDTTYSYIHNITTRLVKKGFIETKRNTNRKKVLFLTKSSVIIVKALNEVQNETRKNTVRR